MRKACPPDFAPLSAVASEAAGCRTRHSLALCCRAGVLLFAVPGWCERRRSKQCFLPVEIAAA